MQDPEQARRGKQRGMPAQTENGVTVTRLGKTHRAKVFPPASNHKPAEMPAANNAIPVVAIKEPGRNTLPKTPQCLNRKQAFYQGFECSHESEVPAAAMRRPGVVTFSCNSVGFLAVRTTQLPADFPAGYPPRPCVSSTKDRIHCLGLAEHKRAGCASSAYGDM